jgi:hypothetical protein
VDVLDAVEVVRAAYAKVCGPTSVGTLDIVVVAGLLLLLLFGRRFSRGE